MKAANPFPMRSACWSTLRIWEEPNRGHTLQRALLSSGACLVRVKHKHAAHMGNALLFSGLHGPSTKEPFPSVAVGPVVFVCCVLHQGELTFMQWGVRNCLIADSGLLGKWLLWDGWEVNDLLTLPRQIAAPGRTQACVHYDELNEVQAAQHRDGKEVVGEPCGITDDGEQVEGTAGQCDQNEDGKHQHRHAAWDGGGVDVDGAVRQ